MVSALQKGLRKARWWHVAVILVIVTSVTAIFTPPDPFSQLLYLGMGLVIALTAYTAVLAFTDWPD